MSTTGIVKSSYERAFLSRRSAISGPSVPLRVDIGGGAEGEIPVAPRLTYATARDSGDSRGAGDPSPHASVLGGLKGYRVLMLPGVGQGDPPPVYQAAWGWKVRAWQNIGGTWFQLGSATVKGDGDWNIDFLLAPVNGLKVRVEYQPANRFIQIQDTNANAYTWFKEVQPSLGSMIDLSLNAVNLTKNADAPGIDRIYQGALALWRKFKKYEMSALRNEPIEITYPNSLATGKCENQINGMTVAWSCSYSSSGKI